MACLGCGKQIEPHSGYQMNVGNFTYMMCEMCFKKSGAVEEVKRLEIDTITHNCRYRKLLEVALNVVEAQEQNETLWVEDMHPPRESPSACTALAESNH